MSTRDLPDDAARDTADRLVEQTLRQARHEEVLAIYEDLLQTIWNRLVPTLGRVTVAAILDRSVAATAEHHPFVKTLRVTREGLEFQGLRDHLMPPGGPEQVEIRGAMKELVASLIDLLATLTGDILVRQLLKDVERAR